jgi:hypothetical protein
VLVGIVCSVVGCFVVLRGMAFFGDALAHAILPGWPWATTMARLRCMRLRRRWHGYHAASHRAPCVDRGDDARPPSMWYAAWYPSGVLLVSGGMIPDG